MAKLLPHFKLDVERVVLVPSSGGCFEVQADDRLLYSKLATGKFPDVDQVLRLVEQALGRTPSPL